MTGKSPQYLPIEDVHWLIANADRALASDVSNDPLRRAAQLRRDHGIERGRMLCELFALRRRASRKFARADAMFFTRVGLEQATSEQVAHYKAARFPAHSHTADFCCGIGGDALALGQAVSQFTFVDRSPVMVAMAEANLGAYGVGRARGMVSDVRALDLSDFDCWHIDPDRRLGERRLSAPNRGEPPLSTILSFSNLPAHGAVKLSPAADWTHLNREQVELEWIGSQGECQQLVMWCGALARYPGRRTATWLYDQTCAETLVERTEKGIQTLEGLPCFLYEPRPSVLAAGLTMSMAHEFSLGRIAPDVAYLASNERVTSQLFRRFKTIDWMAYRRKTLLNCLAQLGLRVTEVKKRGLDHILPNQLLHDLANQTLGDPAVLMLIPVGKSVRVVIAQRDDVL